MVSVVVYFWRRNNFSDERDFQAEHVNILARKVKKNLSLPHRFICITDEVDGFSNDVELFKLPDSAQHAALIPTAEKKKHFPSCYRRLWTFSEEAKVLGDVVLLLDIDCLILDLLNPLFEFAPDADFVGWNPRRAWGETKVGGGTWRLRTGTRTEIWNGFSYKEAERVRSLGYRGSDQAILSYRLGKEPVFPLGWISNSQDMRRTGGGKPPKGTKIQHWNGRQQFWHLLKTDWIRDYYTGS